MTDFFKFRNSLEEAKKSKSDEEKLDPVGKADADIDNDGDVDSSDEYLKNRRKAISKAMKKEDEDEDGPCWSGYKQVGMKMKDGKEVPNCVPEETQNEQVTEGYYDYPDYGPIGASEMAQTQLHFIKYAADDITRCLKMGCPMPEWYQNKLAKIEGDMEGLYSYMKGKTRKMRAHQSDRYSMGMSGGMYEETLPESFSDQFYFVTKKERGKTVYLQYSGSLRVGETGPMWVNDPENSANAYLDKKDAEKLAKRFGGKVQKGVKENKSSNDDGYDEFFQAALKKFGVKGIGELDKEKKKEFFNYVDKNWKADDEQKNESVQIDEKSLARKINRKINKILSFTADKPDEMRREIGKMSDDELLKLKGAANENPGSGSARKLQIDLINREMKKRNLKESYISEKLKPSDDVSKWIEDFYDSDAPQFKGKDKEERREMAVAAWLEARREAGYDVDPNPNE